MLELTNIKLPSLYEVLVIDILLKDLKVDITPTDFFLFPEVHLETKIDIHIKP